jgi:hypothetical protein
MNRKKHENIQYDNYRISPALKENPYNLNVSSPMRSLVGGGNKSMHFFGNEYEELILEDVTELGKYIISIDISENYVKNHENSIIEDYLIKYPHIKLNMMYQKNNLIFTKPLNIEDIVQSIYKSKKSLTL